MPAIKEVTVSIGPTLKVQDTYLKAAASVTLTPEVGDTPDMLTAEALNLCRAAYKIALRQEVRLATRIQRQTTLESLIEMLTENSDAPEKKTAKRRTGK